IAINPGAGNTLSTNGNLSAGGDVTVGDELYLLNNAFVVSNGAGTAGQVLTSQGPGSAPKWATLAGDNWGTQVAQVQAPITGDGTGVNPLGLDFDPTTLYLNPSNQLAVHNTSALWNADKLCGTPLDCPTISGLGMGDAGKSLTWDGTKWIVAAGGSTGDWAIGGNALAANGSLGATTNYAVIFIANNEEGMRLVDGGVGLPPRLDFVGGTGTFRIDLPNNSNNAIGRARAQGWSTYSSIRWKDEIRPIENALEKVLRLRGVAFRWKPEYGGTEDIGFIMEEVAPVVPQVVDRHWETGEMLGLEYSRLTALLTEALKQHVREQQQVNARLQQENEDLRRRVERLESLVEQLLRERGSRGGETGGGVQIHDAWLGQNIPNPFEGTTTIPYYIPAGVGRAELVVRDRMGQELRRVELPERGAHGQVTLEMRLLGAGVYEYSLVLDGRVVATKQMTLVR
ncbi:MAG: tail fiber domain-containing protein, partial [Bacteroidota bacterium]|nr:tail fiber domain-containing protein [Bacteroidota bacterium]